MIVYEVNLFVREEVASAFRDWLERHVREMLALPGFLGAEVFERIEPAPEPGECVLCTHYRLRDEAALDDYLREHSARMRADGQARFGGKFRADRRVLRELD